MKLLGPYNSKLQAFHYEELLQLYKQAIAKGDFAGNKTFDESAINTLIQQSQDFATLPLASEGQRVTDDSLNHPLDLLETRFNAITSEAGDFDSRAAGLINVLEKDTILLDQLLAGADLQDWAANQPQLRPSAQFSWDYGMGTGASSTQIVQEDPVNGVIYPAKCQTNTYLDIVNGDKLTGLVAPEAITSISAKNMKWSWSKMTSGEQSEDLYGDGWTELNLLEDRPLVNFLPHPSVQVVLPIGGSTSGVFNVDGFVDGGYLPVFIRTLFVPRRNQTVIVATNALPSGTFEPTLTGWTLGGGWTQVTGADAHTGSKYASKAPLSAWSSITTYAIGDAVRYLNRDYKSLINSNLNNLPDAPGSTSWIRDGLLVSPAFPLRPLDQIYMEAWVKNLSSNGIFNIALSCRDSNDNEITPQVAVPGITSATDYVLASSILKAVDDPSVATGRLVFSVYGQTTGAWALDDVRLHTAQNLSPYTVNQDEVDVYIPKPNSTEPLSVYFENEEYIVDDIGNITLMNLVDGTTYTVRFTENYPAYQCSINEKAWSPIIMLDPNRPYPDSEQNFNIIELGVDNTGQRTLFPITDETGTPSGLTLQMVSRPQFEYYLQVTTPAPPQYGATAILEVDLERPSYLDGMTISPFSTYPIRLVRVETESFTVDTRQTIGAPNALLDRPMVLTFPTSLLRKVYLTFYQENYNLSEHIVQPPDALRRDTLFALQTSLPFNVRRTSRAVPRYYRGAQYVFGLENIAGIIAKPELPGVFIAGPYHFSGKPEVYRYDADFVDVSSVPAFTTYLCWRAYDKSGNIVDENLVGHYIVPGTCDIFPFPNISLTDKTHVNRVDVFLKFVLRDPSVVLQRYLLQISNA